MCNDTFGCNLHDGGGFSFQSGLHFCAVLAKETANFVNGSRRQEAHVIKEGLACLYFIDSFCRYLFRTLLKDIFITIAGNSVVPRSLHFVGNFILSFLLYAFSDHITAFALKIVVTLDSRSIFFAKVVGSLFGVLFVTAKDLFNRCQLYPNRFCNAFNQKRTTPIFQNIVEDKIHDLIPAACLVDKINTFFGYSHCPELWFSYVVELSYCMHYVGSCFNPSLFNIVRFNINGFCL